MRNRGRRTVGWSVAVVLALVVGCSSSSDDSPTSSTPAPSATELISKATAAITSVTSAHFVIAVTGTLPELTVQSAEGDLTTSGDAQGKATVNQLGQLLEVEFVVVEKDLYLKGATGGYTKLPAALAGQIYDPTAILNPELGVSKVLSSTTGLSAVSESGDTYAVSGTVPKDVAASLVPGINTDVQGTFGIDRTTFQTRTVSFGMTGSDDQPASVQLELSDFDKPLSITAPAGS